MWYADEDICQGRAGSGKRWIKKQRSIVRRQYKKWLNRPVTYQELFDKSRPKKFTDVQRAELVSRMSQMRASRKTKASVDLPPLFVPPFKLELV